MPLGLGRISVFITLAIPFRVISCYVVASCKGPLRVIGQSVLLYSVVGFIFCGRLFLVGTNMMQRYLHFVPLPVVCVHTLPWTSLFLIFQWFVFQASEKPAWPFATARTPICIFFYLWLCLLFRVN